jgi:AraC-like DNA-binding protein
MDTQRPIIFNSYVRQLLKGYIVSDEEAAYAKEYLGLTEGDFVYNSLYIVAYNSVNEDDYPAAKHRSPDECNQIVMEAITKYISEQPYCFSPSDRTYALIVVGQAANADNLIIQTNEVIVKMHDYLLDTYGIWLIAGIGKNTGDIVNVWESYQQAMEAVNYTSKNYIFFPYEFIKKDSSAFYYPPELSTKLIHFITTGNTPQVMELFNLLHQENIEERSLPINMLQFLLSDIRNTLLKARFTLPANTPQDKIDALDESFNQHVSFKLCEDIALQLCKLFTVETDDSNLISAIERYIRENYTDPSLGLNKISDEFQISESYFSHMFKEKTGGNFSTYLENIRMHEAARLIKETDTSLNELYILVGYNNANSFRRAFKKVYGVTPSSMRGLGGAAPRRSSPLEPPFRPNNCFKIVS